MQIKAIMPTMGGTVLTLENERGDVFKAKTYWDKDGKDKVEIDGVVYEVQGSRLEKSLWQPKKA